MHVDLHPKKVRMAIVLITLALCAFFLAKSTTNVIAGKWLPVSLPSLDGKAKAAGDSTPKGEKAPDFHALLARNIFDPSTGSLWPPKVAAAPGDADAEKAPGDSAPPLAPGQMPPACDGQTKLIAAIYSDGFPDWSFATMSIGAASPLLYRPGASVDGKQVDSIYPEAVFLKAANGGLCSLALFRPPGSDKPAPPAAPAAAPADTAAASSMYGSSLSEAELDQAIHQVSDTKFNVQRGLIDKVLANQSELMRSARVVPHEENGKVIGVKLYGIRRSSLLGKLGLQNGDMLRTINGFDMASPDSALEAYTKLRTASNLSVSVVRRGSPVTMEYGINAN